MTWLPSQRVLYTLLLSVCLAGFPVWLAAHPHVFIDSSVVFGGTNGNPDQIRAEWRFDEIFSQGVFADFPKPKSGNYEGKVLAKLKDGNFDNLKSYGFFTRLFVEGKRVPVTTVSDFAARAEGGNLIYDFTIGLPVAAVKSKVVLCFFDESFFVSFNKMELKQVALDKLSSPWQLSLVEIVLPSQGWGPIKADEMSLNKDDAQ